MRFFAGAGERGATTFGHEVRATAATAAWCIKAFAAAATRAAGATAVDTASASATSAGDIAIALAAGSEGALTARFTGEQTPDSTSTARSAC